MTGSVQVRRERCKGCYLCLAACPNGCLQKETALNSRGVHPVRIRAGALCTGCANCAVVCPDVAILVFRERGKRIR